MDIRKLTSQPIFFNRNRVFRVYTGGMPFKDFFMDNSGYDDGEDGYFPEEWIASYNEAINEKKFGLRDGVSVIENTDVFFDDLLKGYPEDLLGDNSYNCLVKILDSAVRLPFQAHPTKEFSRKHLNSNYGKTEAWLVLATRPGAKIYFGFKDKITKEEIARLEEESETDKSVFDNLLSCVDAKAGDVYLIRAGLVHAIGAGCTILEVQEPTDFTIQPERWCGEYHLNSNEEFCGLTKDVALDVLDYSLYGESARESAFIMPKTVTDENGYKKEILISHEDTPCFTENRHTLRGGSFVLESAPAVYICVEGEGKITGDGYERNIKRGDYFFLPYSAKEKFKACADNCVLVECKS